MEQPKLPSATATSSPPPLPQPPTAEEMVAYYESKGMDSKEASLKVIRQLQAALYRKAAAATPRRGRKNGSEAARVADSVSARLAVLEAKVDQKPGFLQALGVGVAAGVAVPEALAGLRRAWGLVSRAADGGSGP